jgi:hypothetical protein
MHFDRSKANEQIESVTDDNEVGQKQRKIVVKCFCGFNESLFESCDGLRHREIPQPDLSAD